jgi:hypothetical protein
MRARGVDPFKVKRRGKMGLNSTASSGGASIVTGTSVKSKNLHISHTTSTNDCSKHYSSIDLFTL